MLAAELAALSDADAERRRGCVVIRQASLLRAQIKTDLAMHFGFYYYSDLRSDDRRFLKSCGLSNLAPTMATTLPPVLRQGSA